jgi:hypothetical protein
MRVRAKEKGYYDHVLREQGSEFEIASPKELGAWMEPLEATTASVSVGIDLKNKKEK